MTLIFRKFAFLCAFAALALPSAFAGVSVSVNPVAVARAVAHPKKSVAQLAGGNTARRITGAIAAAADIGDMLSTHRAICTSLALLECQSNGLAHEVNPLFAPNGQLLAKRFDLTKLIVAGVLAGGEELPGLFHAPHLDAWNRVFTVANVPAGLFFTGLTVNNTVVYLQTHK